MLSSIILAGLLAVQTQDSLQAVTVVADRGMVVSRTDTVLLGNSSSITEALSEIPGLYVGDNGGLSGLKSVSLRGLGSPHTAIYMDGVRIGNVQSGQADLGMLDLENCGEVAVDYAQNSLNFNTAKPVFSGHRTVSGQVRFHGGSFGTYIPSTRLDFALKDKLCMSATASGTISKGDFPYGANGARRSGNDMKRLRSGLDFWGRMAGGNWHAKAFFNGSDRGTPGSVLWLTTDGPQERQKDRNAFIQATLHKQFSSLYFLSASAKAAYDDLLYSSGWGDSRYRQGEGQLNTAHEFSVCRWFEASVATDIQWDGLYSTEYTASRTCATSTATATFRPGNFRADLALEYSAFFDRTRSGEDDESPGGNVDGHTGGNRNVLSPSADIRWRISESFDIAAFARRAYRTPTFNELFYPGFGNPDLKAEDAVLTDIGAEYHRGLGKEWNLSAKVDGFYNYLKDKIISAPTADPAIWLPYNVGAVRMDGADIQTSLKYGNDTGTLVHHHPCRWKAAFSARYSLQNAKDKTAGSSSFGQQIPYIARHSVYLYASASFNGWSADINWNWRGGRFDSEGPMPDYNTLDLCAGKDVALRGNLGVCLKFIARNLCDCRYELSSGFPMPGRAFYGEISLKF